jgi:pimeloyl-ACP methyl ester carboxylesterase
MATTSTTAQVFAGALDIRFLKGGQGRPYLILHGGAGPGSVLGLAEALAQTDSIVAPIHPGFDGSPRPQWFATVDGLALAYLALIDRLDLDDVVIIGNSVGGWIAAEMALKQSARVAGIVLMNAVGIDTGSAEKAIVDPSALAPMERAAFAFHDPARFAIAPSGPDAAAAMAENQRTLRIYAGEPFMHDPTLHARLSKLVCPALVVWGESDRIVDVDYGRRYAQCMAGAGFEIVPRAAHFPQIEQLDEVSRLISRFVADIAASR